MLASVRGIACFCLGACCATGPCGAAKRTGGWVSKREVEWAVLAGRCSEIIAAHDEAAAEHDTTDLSLCMMP